MKLSNEKADIVRKFRKVLKEHDFVSKQLWCDDIIPFQLGDKPECNIYVEIYLYGTYISLWIVGIGIPDKSYPGGQYLEDPAKLEKLLSIAHPLYIAISKNEVK